MFGNELSLALVSYGLAFAGYLVLAGLLLTRYKGRLRNGLLAAAALTTSLWALFYAVSPYFGVVSASQLYFAEATHNAVWIVYVTALTAGAAGAGQYWLASSQWHPNSQS